MLVLALLIAVVQGWPSWHLPATALGIVLFGQFLEGNVLSPKLVGDKVGLHPVWIIFALLAFGSVWGFTGLIVAVPVALGARRAACASRRAATARARSTRGPWRRSRRRRPITTQPRHACGRPAAGAATNRLRLR